MKEGTVTLIYNKRFPSKLMHGCVISPGDFLVVSHRLHGQQFYSLVSAAACDQADVAEASVQGKRLAAIGKVVELDVTVTDIEIRDLFTISSVVSFKDLRSK